MEILLICRTYTYEHCTKTISPKYEVTAAKSMFDSLLCLIPYVIGHSKPWAIRLCGPPEVRILQNTMDTLFTTMNKFVLMDPIYPFYIAESLRHKQVV